jgi:hypothetical protein
MNYKLGWDTAVAATERLAAENAQLRAVIERLKAENEDLRKRPKCRLCGLEDGACICAHLHIWHPGGWWQEIQRIWLRNIHDR